jgi:hypothetical protein
VCARLTNGSARDGCLCSGLAAHAVRAVAGVTRGAIGARGHDAAGGECARWTCKGGGLRKGARMASGARTACGVAREGVGSKATPPWRQRRGADVTFRAPSDEVPALSPGHGYGSHGFVEAHRAVGAR